MRRLCEVQAQVRYAADGRAATVLSRRVRCGAVISVDVRARVSSTNVLCMCMYSPTVSMLVRALVMEMHDVGSVASCGVLV